MDRSQVQTRTIEFDVEDVAQRGEDDPIPVVISSDNVVDVMDGPEILVHEREAIDLSRAPLPIVAGHQDNVVNVGLVDNLRIERGLLRGDAKFGKRPEAAGYRADVVAKIVRSVSVKYARLKARLRSDGVLVTTRWRPSHVALIAEPADIAAGFYRAAATSEPWLEAGDEKEVQAAREQVRAGLQPAAPAALKQETRMVDSTNAAAGEQAGKNVDVQVTQDFDAVKRDEMRAQNIRKLANDARISDEQTIRHWIASGMEWNQIASEIVSIQQKRADYKESESYLGLTDKETKRFSVVKAIRAVITNDWRDAGFEAEVTRTLAQRTNRAIDRNTFMIPADLTYSRVLQVGTASLGGSVVGTDLQAASFIELLRNRSVAFMAGARSLSGLVGSVSIPRQVAAGSTQWLGELGTATENTMTVGSLTLSPKTIAGFQQYTRLLMLQSTPDIDALINNDLARSLAVGLDAAILAGTSTDSTVPLGIRFTSGIGTANPGTGSAVAYADMIKHQTTVAASNALMDNFAYFCHPAIAGVLMGKPRFTNSDTPIWQGGVLDGRVVGRPAYSTVQITSGTMLSGAMDQVLVGEWGSLAVEVNPTQVFAAGIVGVRAMWTVDVGIRYPAAFAVGTGITG